MDSLSFESFHAELDCKLMYSNKITEVSPLKKWREILDYVSCFSLLFFCALATSCMLYRRTEHSQGFSTEQYIFVANQTSCCIGSW